MREKWLPRCQLITGNAKLTAETAFGYQDWVKDSQFWVKVAENEQGF
ncbi:MAG: hypothetical protein V4722_03125 [Bacteroidota bacterium]